MLKKAFLIFLFLVSAVATYNTNYAAASSHMVTLSITITSDNDALAPSNIMVYNATTGLKLGETDINGYFSCSVTNGDMITVIHPNGGQNYTFTVQTGGFSFDAQLINHLGAVGGTSGQ